MKKTCLIFLMLLSFYFINAQIADNDSSAYNPKDFYLPQFNMPEGNLYRSANGEPGPMYWQNSANYLIHASLNDKETSVSGDVTISYTNNSPDKLDYLWLQLDQNLFDPKSRGAAATPVPGDRFDVKGFDRGGYHIASVTVTYHDKTYTATPVITDTRMQLRLNTPLLPKGDSVQVKVVYSFVVPIHGADRMGRTNTSNGIVYEIAQWYPRMCVYDDAEGWNTLPYMGLGEFYCEYGNYDYYITAPAEMIVYASGDLQNASDVLTPEEIKRLAAAASSNNTITIIKPDEIGKPSMRPSTSGSLIWHFKMDNTRDVAWAASKALIWDAAKINLPSGRAAIAMSAYPVESTGNLRWTRATEYLKTSIEIYSKNFFEYPWNTAVNIGASVTGMEYPGIIFCDANEKKSLLWDLIAHEIGHNWYPMIVGSNERRYMWQDEGFNTYINDYASAIFNNGEYAEDTALIHFLALDMKALPNRNYPLMTLPEAMSMDEFGEYYNKTSAGLKMLSNVVIGKDRFDYAFRKYTEAWAFKHPTPYDFFHFINNAAGEDLNWFWKEWFFTNWTLDQAVTGIEYVDGKPSKGVLITIENKNKMIMPAIVQIIQKNGNSETIQLPVEIWQRGGTWTFRYASTSKIDKIILDPDNILPDINRSDNTWKPAE